MADKRPCIFPHGFDGEWRLVSGLRADKKISAPTVGVADGWSSAEPSHRLRLWIRAACYTAAFLTQNETSHKKPIRWPPVFLMNEGRTER